MNFKVKGQVLNANTTGTGKNVATIMMPNESGIGAEVLTVFTKNSIENQVGKTVELKVNAFVKMAFEV
jgi:hypothetical protein